ncbi:helix-hairpin-helix domain-containing protein [Aliifodinibius salicampi]|uniref:Helix-hairpin-helix domain-containing protein n=1 Tax=Fodinibius salicampi TaxID=1920655 RepID=A0ABT3Q325_9BACT|nr:helix-hairpin-helix domain-containing protein [Fodinibius salicampi]MCW9714451.1 helix-hairpin-helix domain-containing protein [Fodinibius salicampi]
MKRRLFFWLEKLKITPAERKSIVGLMIILVVLAVSNIALSPSTPFDGEYYHELEAQFRERTAQLEAEKKKRMDRYLPPTEKSPPMAVISDTITTKEEDKESDTQAIGEGSIERINVNTADQETLQTLPGIGPAYSERIIIYREENGGFKRIEELKEIKGIGEKRLEKLKPFVKLKDS